MDHTINWISPLFFFNSKPTIISYFLKFCCVIIFQMKEIETILTEEDQEFYGMFISWIQKWIPKTSLSDITFRGITFLKKCLDITLLVSKNL